MSKKIKLPLVLPFNEHFEVWSTREPTLAESHLSLPRTGRDIGQIKEELITTVSNELEAAYRVCDVKNDPKLRQHINDQLDLLVSYKNWMKVTDSVCPKSLTVYQENYPNHNSAVVDADIKSFNLILTEGQILFHAGAWPIGVSTFKTTKPFSTSFCPEAAFRNGEHKAKAYHEGKLDLFVITVKSSSVHVFPYPRVGHFAHENEVLFSSGATFTKVKSTVVDTSFRVVKDEYNSKLVPVSIIEVDLL